MGKKKQKKDLIEIEQEGTNHFHERFKSFLPYLGVFLIGFMAYSNTLKADFIWDDEYLIINNSQIKNFSHLGEIFKTYVGYGSENINNFYRPMQELSDMIDYGIWGLKPFGFHLTNVTLHSLVGVFLLLLMFQLTGNKLASFICAAFYVVHPVHTEAVAYIAGRADPLYAMFFMLSYVFFIKSLRSAPSGPDPTRGLPNLLLYSLSVFFFIVSILSKEMVMIMPLLIWLYLYSYLKNSENASSYTRFKWTWVPYAVVVVIYAALRSTVLDFSDIAPASLFNKIPFVFRLLTFFRTVAEYFKLVVLPLDLHMERSIAITKSIFDLEAIFSILMIASIVWVTYKSYKTGRKIVFFGINWFFINLLPVSNIVPINSFLAEHWIYTAIMGPFILLGLGLAWLWRNIPPKGRSLRIGFTMFVSGLLLAYGNGTYERNKDWKDEVAFFSNTLKYQPNNTRLYLNLGNTYYEKGDTEKAIAEYEKCIKLDKTYAIAYGNIGSVYLQKEDLDKALEYLLIAVKYKDNYPIAHFNLGLIYNKKDDFAKAKQEFIIATEQLPQFYQAWNMLGQVYWRDGNLAKAKETLERSLAILPGQEKIVEALKRIAQEAPPSRS
ncbi:MAG: tetratricopeptide repeat protein [Candidatus Omnitrophica bacterium]|nr:tetratricopeptide repeat protein [Candidatus Omnitrophota bacterium]